MQINLTLRNTKISKKIKEKLFEKINKHENLLSNATSIEAIITKLKTLEDTDIYELKIAVKLPRAYIKVKEEGSKLEDMIDRAENTLSRRLKRYKDLLRKWEGEESWKTVVKENYYQSYENIEDDSEYNNFEPIISKKLTYEDDTPRHPAEAIELMELLGKSAFLFKNIETGKHCMVYKLKNGTYALIEPPSL